MIYEVFKEEIVAQVRQQFDEGYELETKEFTKNNGCKKDGLIVKNADSKISPIVYLYPYYEEMLNYHKSLGEIAEEIIRNIQENEGPDCFNIDNFMDFNIVKDKIVFRLINAKQNEEFLKDVPHMIFLDLAMIFCVLIEIHGESNASVIIRNEHIKMWDTNADHLIEIAKNNTPLILKEDVKNMAEMIMGQIPEDSNCEVGELDRMPMYVMTNRMKTYGAACILYPGVLDEAAKMVDDDLFILPSSIHETIFLPAKYCNAEELTQMINEVNATQLAKEEILADHPYFYSREKGELVAA